MIEVHRDFNGMFQMAIAHSTTTLAEEPWNTKGWPDDCVATVGFTVTKINNGHGSLRYRSNRGQSVESTVFTVGFMIARLNRKDSTLARSSISGTV